MNIIHKIQLATLIVIIVSVSTMIIVYNIESESAVAVSDENSFDATFSLPENWEEKYTENFEIDYTEKFD